MPTPFPPRWRRRWRAWRRRSSFAWWVAAALLVLLTGGAFRASLARTSARLDELGPLRPVVVVTSGVEAGAVVSAGDVAVARRPAAMVPDGAITSVDGSVGRVAIVPLVAGEVLVATRLAPDGLRGAAALVPGGMRALAVPGGPSGRPPLAVGDLVDAVDTAGAVVVATAATVVAVDDRSDTVTVAVPADDAPGLAAAVATGGISLALSGREPPR